MLAEQLCTKTSSHAFWDRHSTDLVHWRQEYEASKHFENHESEDVGKCAEHNKIMMEIPPQVSPSLYSRSWPAAEYPCASDL
jgi:hypothetical protein